MVKKYVAGRKYEQGYLDRLKESVAARHGRDATMKQSLMDRAKESRGMFKAAGERAYRAIDKRNKMRAGRPRACCAARTPACNACRAATRARKPRTRKTKK